MWWTSLQAWAARRRLQLLEEQPEMGDFRAYDNPDIDWARTAYVQPPFVLSLPFVLSGSPGAAGAGFGELLLPVPAAPSLVGVTVHAQAGMLDAGAVAGVALTSGLRLVLGG